MRTDITHSFEDFERIAEDYFELIPPDTDSFDLELCTFWEYEEWDKLLIFHFDNEMDLNFFYDKLIECPKYEESFDIEDHFEGVNRKALTITIESKSTGL